MKNCQLKLFLDADVCIYFHLHRMLSVYRIENIYVLIIMYTFRAPQIELYVLILKMCLLKVLFWETIYTLEHLEFGVHY